MDVKTYKTLFIDKFTDGDNNLATMLSKGDRIQKQDLDSLTVSSFDEFLKKFAPVIYQNFYTLNEKTPYFKYSTDPKDNNSDGCKEIRLTDNAYFKMILNLYQQRGASNQSNLEFNAENILRAITPEGAIRQAQEDRKLLDALTNDFNKAKREHKKSVQIECRDKIFAIRERILESKSDAQKLIPLALDTCNKYLENLKELETAAKKLGKSEDGSTPLLTAKSIGFDDNGALEFKPALPVGQGAAGESKSLVEVSGNALALAQKSEEALHQQVRNMIETDLDDEGVTGYTKELILSTYAPLSTKQPSKPSIDEIQKRKTEFETKKKSYELLLAQAQNDFIKTMGGLVQKILNVKAFFDHASLNGGLKDGVIIANCKPDDLDKGEIYERFKDFAKDYGKNVDRDKIWFAVLPGIEDSLEAAENEEVKYDEGADLETSMKKNRQHRVEETAENSSSGYSWNAANKLLKALNDGRIMTVFNFAGERRNTFEGITKNYLRSKREALARQADYRFGVFAYPNFKLCDDIDFPIDRNNEESQHINVKPVYVDAACVAAGMLAGIQEPEYLKAHELKVLDGIPGVHVNFENEKVRFQVPTHMPREMTLRMPADVREEIIDNRFGFAFCGDAMVNNKDEEIQNTYVLMARTLHKNKKMKKYQSIYCLLTENYIRLQLMTQQYDKTVSNITSQFIKGTVKEWKNQSLLEENKGCVNLLLLDEDGEDVTLSREDGDKPSIHIKFKNDETIFEDIEFSID